jgi:hypothetical protein
LEDLERAVRDERQARDKLVPDLTDELRRHWRNDDDALRTELDYRIKQLDNLLSLAGRPKLRRWIGLLLFAIGLGLQTWANLVPAPA